MKDQAAAVRTSSIQSDITECANEVGVAIETLKIAFPNVFASHVGKTLLQRKFELQIALSAAIQS